MERILITGATGLIGKKLVEMLHREGVSVNYLTTNRSKLAQQPNYRGFYWNPATSEIDENCFEGVSVIINLAGAPIAKRWTRDYKQEILDSRVKSIELLATTVAKLNLKIDHFITASAIGYYPSSEVHYYDETFESDSDDFIVEVVRSWERAADEFTKLDVPVTKIRIGLVLSQNGGALEKIAKPIRNFAGAALGSGKQWQSWIHIDDVTGIFLYCKEKKITGVINAVAPNAVSNEALVKAIADQLERPLILPNVPVLALRVGLGEMHEIVTEGHRVSSKTIENLGYHFRFHHLDAALGDLL
ncbi:MAG: TIGR01777 family oxidoreductase [Bacteroidia bacterium]|nr:TIGR01777 family oxidoreductase [Bacteroidia bacterium]